VAVRPIRVVGDPVLSTPTRRVEEVDDELRTLVADMFDTMAAAHGVLIIVASVCGTTRIDEAKIGGITPDTFSFSGRCEDSPP